MTKQQRLYGKLVVDFANAKSSDEACFKTLANMQETFGFSEKFEEKVRKIFPTIVGRSLDEIPQLRKEESKIVDSIRDDLWDFHSHILKDYDRMKQILMVKKLDFEVDPDEGMLEDTVEDFGELYEIKINQPEKEYDPTLIKIEPLLNTWKRMYLFWNHDDIENIISRINSILEEILIKKNLYHNTYFTNLISRYNVSKYTMVEIDQTGSITKKPYFEETYFLNSELWEKPNWGKLFEEIISYCLLEFLLADENTNYLHMCQNCDNYFIGKTLRAQKFCDDKCRLGHHNRRRIESGEHAAYKRKKREEGAKESYYG